MNLLQVSFDDCRVKSADRGARAVKCLPSIEHIRKDLKLNYDSPYASIQLPFDEQLKNTVLVHAKDLQKLDPALLIIIGIGGSNLGTKAIHEACLGAQQQSTPIHVSYVDTVDPDMVRCVQEHARQILESGRVVLINIVTKSGTTTETIANAAIFIELLKCFYPKNYGDYIIVTTDTESKLADVARREKWRLLEIPTLVGGRYSVFSAVGLLPLALIGIDIDALLRGAAAMGQQCISQDIEQNIAVQSAVVLYELYQQGFVINNFFPFSVDFYALGLWYRQLVAESLGKEFNLDGKQVNIGITPTVSVGSTDLHSIVELHLGGPKNTCTTFVDILQFRSTLLIPSCKPLEMLVPHIQGKSAETIMKAILGGTQKAYTNAERPYITVIFKDKSEEAVGQFMQWKMLEAIYLGYLFNINPFIQPQVESYKKETRALLARMA